MNSGKSRKSRRVGANGFLKKFVILWALASFILSSCPAYASRHDRLDLPRGDRQEQRAERVLQRALTPIVTRPSIQPQLTPIFQNSIANRVGTLEQPRLTRANLVTTHREVRNTSVVERHSARNQLTSHTVQALDSGRARNVNASLNLDLGSTQSDIVLGDKLFGDSSSKTVTLTIGGEEKTFSSGSKVTAAEYASILQALNGGQSLVLDDKGRASGGKLDFSTLTANGDNLRLSSLVIPEQVQAVGNFSHTSDVKLNGDLVNFGSVYAISNRDGGTKATIATTNLHNQEGGLISSVTNSSLGDNLAPVIDLKLHADDTLSNSGRIESSGDLTLSAGSQLINGNSVGRHDAGSSSASAIAHNNLYIEAPVISNSGLLAANTGNINVTAPVSSTSDGSITVNNDRGTFQALNGNINFRDPSVSGKPSTTITGGDLLSKELNIFGGDGAVDVRVNNLTGGVSVNAGTAHVAALEGDLTLNSIVTSGDPTVSSAGNLFINATITTGGGPLALIAGGNIIFANSLNIDTSNGAGAGGNILMVAGANFEDATTPTHLGDDWILGGTAAGGNIFSSLTTDVIQINSNGTTNAGSIQMLAFESTTGTQGTITVHSAQITAIGGSTFSNGDVTATGEFIDLGTINNRGAGTTATGNVSLNTFLPTIVGGKVVVTDASGAIASGSFGVGGTPITPGSLSVQDIIAGNNVALRSSSNLIMSGPINARSAMSGTALANIFFDSDSSITAPAGVVLVSSGGMFVSNITAPPTNNFISTNNAGNAGDITIVAGAAFTEAAGSITINGIAGGGGTIDFLSTPLEDLTAVSTATGTGGDITIAAFGSVSLGTNSGLISASGAAGQTNGTVTIVGSAASGFTAVGVTSEIVTTGGTAGFGNITLSASTPSVPVTVSKTTGSLTAGTFLGGAQSAGNLFTDLLTGGGSVTLTAGGNAFTSDIVSGNDVSITTNNVTTGTITVADAITVNAGGTATFGTVTGSAVTAFNITAGSQVNLVGTSVHSLSVASLDDIEIDGNITSPNGIAMVAGLSIFTNTLNLNISTAAAAGGGDIVMVAGATWSQTAGTITVTGANAAGGAVDFDFANLATLNSRGTAGNAVGGDITLVAFDGTVNNGFVVTDSTTAITTGGSGTGANGNFTAIAGGNTGNTIGLIGTLNTTGGSAAGTGNVLISARTPVFVPNEVIQRSNATFTNSFNNGVLQNGTSFVGAITVNQANITLEAGGAENLGGTLTSTNGAINVTAGTFLGAAAVNAGTGSISLVSGNNTILDGNLSARSGIVLVSGHDIFMNTAGRTISTSGAGASGDVVIISGAAFNQTAATVTITGASATGGQIDFDFNNLTSLNTTSTAGGGAGGDVTLVSFTGSDATGRILSDATTTILTSGNGAGANGNFTAIAGGTSGTTIGLLGTLNTAAGSAAGTGNVLISARTPVFVPNEVIQRSNATFTNTFSGGALQNGTTFVGAITVNQADITLEAGGAENLGALTSATGAINVSAGTFMATAAINAGTGSIALVSGNDMQLGGNLSARTGILLVSGHDIFPTVSGRSISTSGSGPSGDVAIIAGAAFTQTASTVTITGASATGGQIDFDFNDLAPINTTSTGAGGVGGDVTLVAFTGSAASGRVLMDTTVGSIVTGGNGGGTNGNVIVIAGNNTDFGVQLRNVNTTGGLINTGDISITTATPDASPSVVFQKSGATTLGSFGGNPANNSSIAVGTLTVNNGADITISGGAITATSLLGGANSVLTMTSTGATSDITVTNPVTLGTANVTSARDLSISLNQGAAGVATLSAAGNVALGTSTSGAINISAGSLDVVGAVTANSFSGVSTSDITLNNDITAPSGILLVSGRDIFPVATNVVDLSTASATTNAGDITIIAGAAFLQNAATVTITGASATGGFIDFDTDQLKTINARSTALNGSGGDVTMIAFNGSDNTGFVFTNFTTTIITTGGSGTGTNGNFTAVAAASQFDGMGIRGTLNTTGGNGATGDVYIATATPVTALNPVIQKASASITTGDFRFGPAAASNLFVDNIIVGNGADITLNSGGDVSGAVFTGGANSVLTINSVGSTLFDSTTLGTATITAGVDVTINNAVNQGVGASSMTIIAGGDTTVDAITSGSVRIQTGNNLFLGNTVTSGTSFSGVAGHFIDISNDITAPGGILMVAGESINAFVSGVVDLSTASATANAGDITIIAGAAFSQNAGSVTINGASATGGSIDFDFNAVNSISTRSTAANGVGGDITMIAFRGSTAGTGFVFTNPAPSTILTGGTGGGANGNLIAIGNANSGFGVGVRGTLNTTGGLVGTGDVYVAAATPVTSTPVVVQKASASITAGDFRGGATATSDVFVDVVTVSNGADVTLISGANITADTVTAGPLSVLSINSGASTTINASTAGTVTITAGTTVTAGDFIQGAAGILTITAGAGTTSVDQINTGNVRISSGGFLNLTNTIVATGSVSALATAGINFSNNITAPGGILLVSGRDISPIVSGLTLSTASASTDGGDISLIAGATFTQTPTTVTITGASATGGLIDFDFFGASSITSRSTAAGGSGGDINMIAFTGTDGTGGVFTDTAGTITTGGTGAGANGNFTAIAGDTAGSAIGIRGSLNTTGGAAGTGNVFLAAATPNLAPNPILSKNTASITTGNFQGGALTGGDNFVDDVTVGAGSSIVISGNGFASVRDLTGGANSSIQVTAGTSATVRDITGGASSTLQVTGGTFASVRDVTGGLNSSLRVSAGTSADIRTVSLGTGGSGNVSIVAGTFMLLNGNVTAPGGILMVAGGDIFPNAANLTISTSSNTGDAGDLTLVSGAAFSQNAGTVTITGASATGGRIDMDANNTSGILANSSSAGGAGGDITLVTLFGTANTGEVFTDATTVINAGGNGAGANGNITMVSSKNNGANGIFLNNAINLTGGAPGTGSISLNTSALPGAVTLSKSTGSVTLGTFLGGALVNSGISSNNLTVRGGNITARSGAGVILGALDASGNVIGAGGTINVSTASATSLLLGAVSPNSVASLNARGGTTSGSGGSILAANSGAGGITVAGVLNVGATEGNGGHINLNASAGDLTFNLGATTLNASGATASATARLGGTITLTGNNIVGAANVSLTANGVSGGNGGAILVTTNGGDITVGTGTGEFVAAANGPSGSINFTANAGGDIVVQNTGSLSAATVTLDATTGALTVNGAVTGTTAVNLQAGLANNITGTATITGGILTITAGTGNTTLNTNVASLTLATNGNVNITETDDITLNAGTAGAGSLTLNATGDDITVGGVVTANGGINLTTSGIGTIGGAGTLASTGQLSITAGTGLVDVNTNVASLTANTTGTLSVNETNSITLNAITVSSLDVVAGTSIAHGAGVIDAGNVNFSALGGDIGAVANFIQINHGGNPVTLTADATGNIFINIAGTGPLSLGTTTGNNITLTSAAPITTTGDVTAVGTLDITTNSLTNANDMTANIINIQSNAGSGLTIDGGAGGTLNATTSINITATFGNLDFFGILDFFGATTLTANNTPTASVVINPGAVITGHDSVTVVANSVVLSGTLIGNPLILPAAHFTIANSQGNVNLGGNIVFNGQDFAILAQGNINITGSLTLIDLSDPALNAGSLLLVAGYDFIPATGGQITSQLPFTLAPNNQSVSGGNINLGAANINLSSGTGNGGKFTAIATTGTNAGTIALGNVNVSSTSGTAGNVLIIGEGGVTVGNVNAAGGGGNGSIQIAVAVPNITGGNVVVTDGVVSGAGSFQSTSLSAGNMVIGSLTGSSVTLSGAQLAGNTINQTAATSIITPTLSVNVGAGTANLGSTTVQTLNATGNGTITVDTTVALQLGTISTSLDTLTLNVSSDGVITTPVGGINDVANLSLTGTAAAGNAIILNGPITTFNSLSLTAAGGTDLTINNLTLTSPNVSLISTAGDVNLTATGIVNASTSATVDANVSFAIAGTITTQTVSLSSGDDILTGDITGTITAPLGMFLISTGGSIGFDVNNRFVSNATQLLLQAGGGGVFVSSTAATVDVLNVSASGQVDLIASGAVTLHDVSSGNGDIRVVQNGIGTLTVAANANLASTEGDIILQNNDLNKKTGKILIDDGATIKGSGTTAGVGEVFITMGPIPIPPYTDKKKPPKGVTVTETLGAGVFLGKKSIETKKETNISLNALGRDLVFSLSGKLGKKNIHVGSNVVITADPPGDAIPTRLEMTGRNGSNSTLTTALFGQPQTALNSVGGSANITSAATALTSTLPSDLGTRASSALLTDLSGKSSSAQLAEKSFEAYSNTDALSAILGDDSDEQANCGVLNAVLVSEVLPNATLPSNQTIANPVSKGSTAVTHSLTEGCAVYAPAHNMTVKTEHAEIAIAGGSVVLVVAGVDGTSVYDLHDSKKEAVQVAFHNQTLALSPGRHAMVCPTEKRTYADANLAELILHRGMHNGRTARGGSVFTSEFAVSSAIDCVPALNSLMASNHPACAKLAAKLTKTQAVILYLSQSKEEFQQHVKSQITAMR